MPSSDEHDWIFDFVLQFLESDKFDASVMDFVDEKCDIFENEEENKFEYTDIHKEFRDHIEALISSNLGELGITSEMFFDSCELGRNSRDINKQVFERMIAMEDFETFKKLMTKRNIELQLEAIRGCDSPYSGMKGGDNQRLYDNAEIESEEDLMKRALEASLQESTQVSVGKKSGGDDEMQEILGRSLMEMEIMNRQAELEQADLEQALALSLALEEERLRLQQSEEKGASFAAAEKRKEEERGASFAAEEKRNVPQISSIKDKHKDPPTYKESEVKDSKTDIDESKGVQLIKKRSEDKEDTAKESSSSVSPTSFGNRVREDDELLSQLDNVSLTDYYSEIADEKSDHESPHYNDNEGRRKASSRPVQRATNNLPDTFAAPKPLQGKKLGYGVMGAIPSISSGSDGLSEKRRQAEEEIKRAQDQLKEQRELEESLRKQIRQIDPDEALKRSKHMAEQRDKLLAIKKAERDAKVKIEEERQKKINDDGEIPEEILRAKIEAEMKARNGKNEEKKDDGDEKKRSAMRLALARRMKLDLIESEELKLLQVQENQFADFDRKLQQVEDLRRDNKRKEILRAEQLRLQQENIAMNVERSAHDLKNRNNRS